MAQPTIGYERDNFGRGFFGGTAVSLSDILGNHTMVFSGAVNGRLSEAQVLALYINQAHRLNWYLGGSQQPLYYYLPAGVQQVAPDTFIVTQQIERFVIRDVFAQSYYPFSRFTRVEFGGHFSNISQAILQQGNLVAYDPGSGQNFLLGVGDPVTVNGPSVSFYGPTVALAHDNALGHWGVGPFAGSRWRIEVSPNFGAWQFTQGLVDWRRYFFARPFTLALRGLVLGRSGRDADLFQQFLGTTELIRGYTAGSVINHECISSAAQNSCPELDQLIGSSLAVVNAELRFPLTRSLVLGFLPVGLPPIEGAIFYDAGLAWNSNSKVLWSRTAAQEAQAGLYRAPLRSWGGSIRVNALGFVVLRLDYTKPLSRSYRTPYWTLSLGPTF